jgi:anti-sigma-K factor RskA
MNCEQLRDHYELFALGIAEEPERDEIRVHLNRQCETCMAGVKKALQTMAKLAGTASPAEPSVHLRRRLLASVGVEQRRFGWAPVWAAAAALSLAAAAYLGYQDWRNARESARLQSEMRGQNNEIIRLTEAFAILNGPDTREATFGQGQPQPPRGKVFLNPAQGVLLMASNLPPAPSGKLYEMWVIPKAGKPVAAGLFQSQTDGTAMHVRRGAVDLDATGAIAVTVENESGADQPTSQPFIVAPVPSPQ